MSRSSWSWPLRTARRPSNSDEVTTEPGLIVFAALTGLRQGELFDLSDTDVGLGTKSIIVWKSKTSSGRRTIPLVREAQEIVKAQSLLGRPGAP
jgi:integrase